MLPQLRFLVLLQRVCAADDFADLGGDRGLTGAVEMQLERRDELARRVRGGAHGGHARRVLAGLCLEQDGEHRVVYIELQDVFQNGGLVRLEDVIVHRFALGLGRGGQQLQIRRVLAEDALEVGFWLSTLRKC